MKKKKWVFSVAAALAACCMAFTGCDAEVRGIESILKTGTNGLTDIYTVYYTDGTTSTFEVTNGSDGQNVTVDALYERYKKENGEISYEEFLLRYLSFTADDHTVINRCLQSTAKVYTQFTQTSYVRYPGGTIVPVSETVTYTGSAVVYQVDEEYSYFITNYHVVYDADATTKLSETIYCYLYGSEGAPMKTDGGYDYGEYGIKCELIGGSVTYDIAVLRAKTDDVKSINENVCAVEFADGYSVGQTAIAIGNPDDAGISVTKGVVSVDNDYITLNIDGTTREYRSIRIDTALYSGNSGGGLFNEKGELIGINNAGNGEEQNINYAIPLTVVKGAVENVLESYFDGDETTNGLYKPTLGFTVNSERSRYFYDEAAGCGKIVEDIYLSTVESGSIAETIGLSAGDRLISMKIDGAEYKLNRYFDISDAILLLTEGKTVSFTYEDAESKETVAAESYTIQTSDLKSVA